MPATFFDVVVSTTRLSTVFAKRVSERACARAGVIPTNLDRASLTSVIPYLETSMRIYLTPTELQKAIEDLKALAGVR